MTLTDIKDRVVAAVGAQSERYSGGDDRPLRGYAITMTVYASLVGTLAGIARLTGRDVPDGAGRRGHAAIRARLAGEGVLLSSKWVQGLALARRFSQVSLGPAG